MKRPLHKLSHFISRTKHKTLIINMYTGDKNKLAMERALFLASTDYVNINSRVLRITFTSLQQLKNIIPIINNKMDEFGLGYPFYGIDKECEEYFNE